jgi:hypothetical protein
VRGFADSREVIPPHKARILAIAGAVFLVHAALLLVFWPHRWPTSYKWLLLPDGLGAYALLALGLQHLNKSKPRSETKGLKPKDEVTSMHA